MINDNADIWLVTGGGRSGKSAYAEALAKEYTAVYGRGVLYIATGIAVDEEMEERIEKHLEYRPKDWITWERNCDFSNIGSEYDPNTYDAILLDCVGNLLMGILYKLAPDPNNFESKAIEEVERLAMADVDTLCKFAKERGKRMIFVTNEVGMGIIPLTKYSRCFRDSLGRLNKYIAAVSDKAVLMVAGLPMVLK